MSRIIQQIATVQFQVDNRKVTASMNALQTEAESLNGKIAAVKQSIKDLGDVPPDNKFLLEYQKQLHQLKKDLDDVKAANRDLMKGVKAADQLWKAAKDEDIERLSIKAIKAGQNGLRKRMENLRPELGGDEQKMYDAYKAVIDEADRVMNVFKSNYATVVQTIRDGGIVSEQAMKSTRDALRDLMEAEKDGTAEHRQLAQQYDFLNESLANVSEMRRREKGEIVNANDARREALKLTEDGIAAARRERDMADAVIAGIQQQKSDLDQLRRFHEDRIAQTEREIAANQSLEEAEQARLADVEKAMRYTENEDRKEAIRLRKKADAARDEAEAKKDAYEQQAEQEKLLRQRVKDTGNEVTALTAKIEALGKTEAKPKVDTSALDAMRQEIADIESQLNEMGGMHTADMKAFNERLWHKQDKMKEVGAQNYKSLTTDPDADYFNFGNKAKKIIKSFAAGGDDRRHDLMYSLSERGGYLEKLKELESEHRAIVKQRTEYLRAMDETGKKDWEEAVRQLDELDSAYSTVISILKDYKQQFDKIKPADDAHMEKYEQLTERRATLMEKMASAEQQSTTATNNQTEAIKKQEEELGKLEQKLKRLEESRDGYQNDVKESLKAVKDMGLTEEDLADDAKVREAVEKKVLEIMEAQAKVGQEIAEQRKKLAGEVKMSDLGGTKADQEFYKKHAGNYDTDQYGSPDDMIERIAHLERLKKIKNGKRFNPDEDWDDDDELDEDAPIMNDKERQAINDELRFLKQHIREELLKTIHEVGDVNKAVEQYTGGDGVSEDAKFGEQLNDKISELKDKIEDSIETTLDRYGEMLNEDRDVDSKMTKEQLTKRVSQHMEYVKEDHGVNRSWLEETQGDIETTKGEIEAKKQLIEQTKQQAAATKESTQSDQQSADVAKQKAELEGQLADATKEHTKAVKDFEAQQEKTNKAQEKAYKAQEDAVALNEKAATAEEKVAHQEEEHAKAMDHQSERLRQIRAEGQRLLDQYEQQKAAIQTVDKAWADADVKQGQAEARKAQNQELTIKSLDDSIRKLKEANAVIDTNSDEWEENTRIIQRLQAALDEMKNKPALMMMTDRMQDVSKLSTAAVTETRKFWEAMVAGAERGSKELAEYEAHLKTITEEEKKRAIEQTRSQAFRVKAGLFTTMGENELRESINAAREYQKTLMVGGTLYNEYSEAIAKAEKHLRDNSVETERAKLSQQEMNNVMRQQLDQGTALTESALRAQQQYWQRLIDDPKTAAKSLDLYKANLKEVQDLQQQQANELRDTRAARLDSPENFSKLSEQEIREAIEAGKQLIQTYETGDARAKTLGENIVRAEEHLKQYGLEAARTAQREADALEKANKAQKERIDLMVKQWNETRSTMSESALKNHERFWQQLIDDPKTAAESLDWYRENLAKVQREIEAHRANVVQNEGVAAFGFFERGEDANASADEVKKQADAMKKWRDSLPKQDGADTIDKINEHLQRVGQTTKKAAEELMDFDRAKEIALQAGDDIYGQKGPAFMASPEEIQAATKSIEKYREELFKTIKAKRDSGEATDAEEQELKELAKYLKDLKFEQDNFNMSREKMETLMKTPVSAANLDELRAAIKRADAELRRMEGSLDENSDKYKELANDVKNAKGILKEMEGQAKATTSAFDKAWSRLKTYVGLYVGASVAMNKLMGTMGDLMDLSDKMGEVRKTTGFTADEVGRLSTNLKQLDTRTGLMPLMETAAKAGQLGLKSLEDVQGFTQAANMLMVALPEMGQEAATEMLKVALATGEVKKIQDQINKGLIEGSSATEVAMTKIGSTIDQLRANSAAAAPQITDFVKRVGAVGAQSGISIDQVAALGATVDALGMRVEMSATALSRMIPAIKNNAFELAKAIGVTPETVRNLFDTGRGMEVILMIFDRIKESGMDADSIENMLGMAGMKDIMKDLNQQGARAGIVFAGLSQNVDELRRNLRTAGEAYEENIAILSEYNKMNDTTAAKWERLKNQVEELFVGDTAQRWFGYIITGMRWIVDLLTSGNGISAGLRTVIVYLGLVKANIGGILLGIKNCGGGLKGIAMWLGIIDKQTKKLAWGNIFTALAMAALYAWHELSNLKTALEKANEALGKTKEEVGRAQVRFEGYYQKLKSTSEALQQARISHDRLSAEVDKLRQSTDKSATATDNLKKKEDELKKSEDKVTQASRDHKSAISDMNSIYGKYLGFILTEANYSNLAAAAHDKVTAAIEREMLMKQRQAAIGDVDSQYAQDIATGYGKLNEKLVSSGKLDRREASQAMSDLQKFLHDNVKYDSGSNQSVISKAVTDQLKREGLDLSKATADEVVALWYDKYLKENYHISDNVRRGITGVERRGDVDKGWGTVYTPFSTNLRGDYASTYVQREQQRGAVSTVYNADITRSEGDEAKAAGTLLSKLEQQAKLAKKSILDKSTNDKDRNVAYGELANALEGLENRINELDPQQDAETINRLRDMAKSLSSSGIDVKKLKKAREEIHATLFERATFNEDTIKNLDTTNPWGSALEAESTDWKNMTAEQLVNRRKQMKDFVNAIQTDTDVQSVLKEDAALKAAIEKGMSSDMRTVIEWYNTERLKIQDELHARHLTNTGDWMDPKKQRNAHKQFKAELDAYLEELDAYYTERKAEIEKARSDEEITEGEAWRRNLKNENEWYNRRAELLKLYAEKSGEVTQAEQDAIVKIIAERTGDSVEFVRAMIKKTIGFAKQIEASGEKGAAMVHDWYAKIDLKTQQSMLKSQQAITKQVKFIEDTLAKERPYDGITKNLQDNLDKMGVLAAKMRRVNDDMTAQDKEPKYSNADITAQSYKEVAFFLNNAADAWSIDIDELLRRMAREGMETTAEEISKSDMLKQAVMGQLRKTYQEVQDAVKKEASQIKKDVDIIWNDDTRGPGGMSMKAAYDKAVARLGMQQDSVSRANSLIGAGPASDNVATRLAMKQIEVQMRMQKVQYDMYRTQANQRIAMLKAEAAEHERIARQMKQENNLIEEARQKTLAVGALKDAENVKRSLGLTLAEETKKEEEQMAELLKLQEESQNRLYTSLREWADLLTSSLQGVMEASHTADRDYYNERAKLNLTGKGGPGAGTYIVIDNEGTSDARAHYEYLDERQALERQREIENDNAVKDAWKKMLDDLNQKMSDTITDQLNAMLQSQSIDANTQAVIENTRAIYASMGHGGASDFSDASKLKRDKNGMAVDDNGQPIAPIQPAEQTGETPAWKPFWQMTEEEKAKAVEDMTTMYQAHNEIAIAAETEKAAALAEIPGHEPSPTVPLTDEQIAAATEKRSLLYGSMMDLSDAYTSKFMENQQKMQRSEQQTDQKMAAGAQSTFAKMTAAANLYGAAYQTMSNNNLSAAQKFEMLALQAAGQAAMSMLTMDLAKEEGKTKMMMPGILGKLFGEMPYPAAIATFAVITALMGGLMGLAVSQVTKSKSQISQATGSSMSAGRLSTGMMTYAEGNVNEFTDPATLTPGRSYNVDAADGKTYRAKYTGTNPKTHITNGPEFHLVGEAGREAIIDAHTTRLMQMDDTGIWNAIQTLYNGGRISQARRRRSGMGVRAFAGGNLDEFEEMGSGMGMDGSGTAGMGTEQMAAFQSSIDRNNELLERALTEGIHARFDVYGKGGLIDSYDQGKKTASRHGEKY